MASGGSVVALKYDGGVLLASDTLLNYGSLAKLPNIPRTRILGPQCAVCATGDYADFQEATSDLQGYLEIDALEGTKNTPEEVFCRLQRHIYYQRNQFSPWLCSFVMIGHSEKNGSFLGAVDSIGTCWQDNCIATGYGGHIAIPLLRRAFDVLGRLPTRAEAEIVLRDCLRALFYRECRTINRYQIADATNGKVVISEPFMLEDTQWSFQGFAFEKTAIIS
jgi:20S proteasome subunit beta 7